jgi:hypothetical protein
VPEMVIIPDSVAPLAGLLTVKFVVEAARTGNDVDRRARRTADSSMPRQEEQFLRAIQFAISISNLL